jgi:Tfp pilus assembly protein PilN
MRTGPLSYVVVAVLAAALIAVTLTVLVGNQVSDRKDEKASLEAQVAQEQATADRFQSFADFASTQQAREQTVSQLARSRFDWERVLRELAIVIPDDVWLTNLNAAVSSDAASGSTSSLGSASSGSSVSTEGITGPTLQIQGCASGHEAVARFLASLHDVDGVTRVTVVSSDRPQAAPSTGTSGATTGGQGCSARGFVAQFSVIVAFDAVQLGATPVPSTTPPADGTQTTTTTPTTGASPETTASTGDETQVSDAQQQLQQQKDSAASKTQKGRDAVNTFIPGTGSAP